MSLRDNNDDRRQDANRGDSQLAIEVGELFDKMATTPEAQQRLEELLRHDDLALREYLRIADLDARLRWMHRGAAQGEIQSPLTSSRYTDEGELIGGELAKATSTGTGAHVWADASRWMKKSPAVAASIAVSILLLLASAAWLLSADRSIGVLTEVAGVKWRDPSLAWRKGSRIGQEQIDLLEGVVEVTLRNDTRLIVEGPAVLSVRSDTEAVLVNGTVTVFVADSVENYVLDSRDVEVVDLGTAFQVTTMETGTELHVIDGQVMAFAKKSAEGERKAAGIRLVESQAVRFRRAGGQVEKIAFAGERMNLRGRNTPLTAIPIAVTGDVQCLELPPESVVVGALESDEKMRLFLECSDRVLTRPIYTDRNSAGKTAQDLGGNLELEVPANLSLNSYLLHYDPKNDARDETLHRVSGTITFRTPIIGVFSSGVGLLTSDRHFRCEETEYLTEGKHIGHRRLENADFVTFSPDRKTIMVNLQANTTTDQLRIITIGNTTE